MQNYSSGEHYVSQNYWHKSALSDTSTPQSNYFYTYLYKILDFQLSILNLFVSLQPLWRDS